ncbi:FAD-dependent oxidoreductase [Priestia koreensis]|uniref:FAD-dependent oxidoreductase n=1 Tax=Priestia koreensis TaxID=284581 RepID=UPI001F573334|nr:FAD-dependent oxidoreductase [Priestia koreensis]UNL83396.1 FAD-dependent oxidoreductase [Priestia koreensis]
MTEEPKNHLEPYWRTEVDPPRYEALKEDIAVDVCIVGGGIAGITTAYLLSKEGVKVALLEADRIVNGTTGHTTAKVTAQHGLIYDELIEHIGEEKTKLYYEINNEAKNFIASESKKLGLDCDFVSEAACIYATTDSYMKKIENEYEAYQRLNIPSLFIDDIPLPFDIKGAVVMKDQAQFHPVKYIIKLAEEIVKNGGKIFEGTVAIDVENEEQTKVVTKNGPKVTCTYVAACSHFPFFDGNGFYYTRMYAERSYVLAVKPKIVYPGGMYYSAESPTRSLRYTPYQGDKLILVSGEGHKTGQGSSTSAHYKALEDFSRQTIGIESIPFRWSAQDLITLDKVPYVGPITDDKRNILVATGFRKWGMTNGTAAAFLLRDIILKRDNPCKEVYNPSRFSIDPSLKMFFKNNLDVAGHLLAGKLQTPDKKAEHLKKDEGAVVSVNGKRCGAYRDKEGTLHFVDTTCTHLGCEVEWNDGDRTWDCPCHGSRFSTNGDVIEGPAKKPLGKID